jgi:uncharacterized membrane protein
MIVIKVSDFRRDLTVDTIDISCDSILYSADATIIKEEEGLSVKFIPRYFVDICFLILRNELSNITVKKTLPMINNNGIAILIFDADIKDATSFEMTVNDLSGNLLFRGKAFATTQEDTQQYTMNKRINNKILI